MKLLFGNLYKKKIMHFKHHMLFFMVEKTKQMVLLDNCKFFFKKEKYSSAKSLFLLGELSLAPWLWAWFHVSKF